MRERERERERELERERERNEREKEMSVKHPSLRVSPLFKPDREGYFINTPWKSY